LPYALEPHPIDLHVGARLRLGRQLRRLPREALASWLGVSFQQIQKYEKGANRISASMLYGLATLLKVEVGWFFEGLDVVDIEKIDDLLAIEAVMATREGHALILLIAATTPRLRGQMLAILRALSDPTRSSPAPNSTFASGGVLRRSCANGAPRRLGKRRGVL
jgi:transcriptional regulator with XRE-family HTH domain